MHKHVRSLPALVAVAVVALVLGSFGTATAAGLTKGTVKKIATKVVDKKASGLSVANAANAANATNLNNLPAAAYQERAAYSATPPLVGTAIAAGTAAEVRQVSLTIPAGVNFAHLTGNASLEAASDQLSALWYTVDAPCSASPGFGFDRRVQFTAGPTRDNATIDAIQPLTGTHLFRLCLLSTGASTLQNASLVVETVAVNGTGGTTRPGAVGGSDNDSPLGR